MMPVLLRFLKMLGGFAALWIGLWLYNTMGCQKVESNEMEPQLHKDAHKSIDQKIRSIDQLSRDDFISFTYYQPGKQQDVYAARVIGLPGDRVEIRGGKVFVNGSEVGSTYVSPPNKSDPKENHAEVFVPKESVYVLCDNRRVFAPFDSRGIGPVDLWAINGKFK